MKSKKKLRRSSTNQVVAGVLGGIAQYCDWNANLLRVLFVVLCLTPGIGVFCLIGYVILAFVMPGEPMSTSRFKQATSSFTSPQNKKQGRKVIRNVEEQDIDDSKKG